MSDVPNLNRNSSSGVVLNQTVAQTVVSGEVASTYTGYRGDVLSLPDMNIRSPVPVPIECAPPSRTIATMGRYESAQPRARTPPAKPALRSPTAKSFGDRHMFQRRSRTDVNEQGTDEGSADTGHTGRRMSGVNDRSESPAQLLWVPVGHTMQKQPAPDRRQSTGATSLSDRRDHRCAPLAGRASDDNSIVALSEASSPVSPGRYGSRPQSPTGSQSPAGTMSRTPRAGESVPVSRKQSAGTLS